MGILDRIRADRFIPTNSVFPAMDTAAIAREMKLAALGTERGRANLPPADQTALDAVEHQIVERVGDLRLKGLENYENHRKIYLERLNRAKGARAEVETEAADAKANFLRLVTEWKQRLVSPREAVGEVFAWREEFRQKSGLRRPAEPARPMIKTVAVTVLFIFLEAVLNGWLFGQKHDFGLLGGWFIAVLISLVNVLASMLLGNFARMKNMARRVQRLPGYLAILGWLAFAAIFNLGVAHFRDAVETNSDFSVAGTQAVLNISATPLTLHTMESWLLLILGVLISTFALLEGYTSADPYPGYSRLAADVEGKRQAYVHQIQDAIDDLSGFRDDASEKLTEDAQRINQYVDESVDALYGHSALSAHLAQFLERMNAGVMGLLATYRDANTAARSAPRPAGFDSSFQFPAVESQPVDPGRGALAEQDAREVLGLVSDTIALLNDEFTKAVGIINDIDRIEADAAERARTRHHGPA